MAALGFGIVVGAVIVATPKLPADFLFEVLLDRVPVSLTLPLRLAAEPAATGVRSDVSVHDLDTRKVMKQSNMMSANGRLRSRR